MQTILNGEPVVIGTRKDIAGLSPTEANDMDAACAALLEDVVELERRFDPRVTQIAVNRIIAPKLDVRVFKVGAATGLTRGKIGLVNDTIEVKATDTCEVRHVFGVEGIDMKFSGWGDSGALIVSDDGAAIGLLFASSEHLTFAIPITPILRRFNCKLLATDGSEIGPEAAPEAS